MTIEETPRMVTMTHADMLELGDLGVVLSVAPQILDHFRKTQAQKLSAIEAEIPALPPNWTGAVVKRDAVLRIVRKHLVNGNAA